MKILKRKSKRKLKAKKLRKHQLHEAIYTPESLLRHPSRLFKQMWFDLLSSRELAWRLLIRDISAQYRQSFLGIIWA
ncbi:MAG: ABC transporter permease, partial [Cyanobacteria bacterium J06641_2]